MKDRMHLLAQIRETSGKMKISMNSHPPCDTKSSLIPAYDMEQIRVLPSTIESLVVSPYVLILCNVKILWSLHRMIRILILTLFDSCLSKVHLV